jgi:hypothetical protein
MVRMSEIRPQSDNNRIAWGIVIAPGLTRDLRECEWAVAAVPTRIHASMGSLPVWGEAATFRVRVPVRHEGPTTSLFASLQDDLGSRCWSAGPLN